MSEQTVGKVPQIRFKGFEGTWKDKPIGEVLSEKKRPITLLDRQRYELITVKRRNEGIVSRGHLLGRDILVKNYAQLEAGDFVISKRQVVHGATGMIPVKLSGAIVSNEYLVAVNNSKLSTEFLTILSSLPDMRQKFFLSSYGVDIEKLFFDAEDWKKRDVTIPSMAEQTQIGKYFRELDNLISLHQRKHDKLVTLKKAMLQKMFPQPGATTPEIRFKGFEGDWVEKRLGEVATFLKGRGLPKSALVPNGAEPCIHYGELFTRYPEIIGEIISRTNSSLDAFRSNANDVLMPTSDVTPRGLAKASCLTVGGVILGGDILVIRSEAKQIYGSFLSYFIRREEDQVLQFVRGSTVFHLYGSDMKNFIFSMPSVSEQTAIATYFRTLDALITQHATQLQKLQQLKSACLEKMFV